jgi:hypothetical protein
MADLRPTPKRGDGERGQLLLIAAFIIAVSFVVLALVVNSAIFTENLATRDDVAGSGEALEYRHEVSQTVGEVLTAINQNNSIDTADQEDVLENNVGQISLQGGIQQSTRGGFVKVPNGSMSTEPGKKVAQDTPREFSNTTADSSADPSGNSWEVVENVESTRNLKINVTNLGALSLTTTDPFEMELDNGTDTWRMNISGSSTPAGTLVTVGIESENVGSWESCSRVTDDGYITIDVTRGLVGGEPCHALTQLSDGTDMWFGLENTYSIEFINFKNIEGTYSFIIDDGSSAADRDNFGNDGTSDVSNTDHDPYIREAIYSASVPYSYYTPDTGYETQIEVAPGEVPE